MKKVIKLKTLAMICLAITMSFNQADLLGQSENENPLPQFLFPSFTKGILKMKDGRTLTAVLDYNMVDEEMVFKQDKVYMTVDKPEEIDTVILQGRKFVFAEKAFYELIVKGPVTLFIQHKSKYTQVGTNTAYGMKSQTNETINVTSFKAGNQVRNLEIPENVAISPATVYWAKINNEMNKFTSERQFLKLFPGREAELKEFIKKNSADIKTREGLIQVGNFINGIK